MIVSCLCRRLGHRRIVSILRWARKISHEGYWWTSKDIPSFEVYVDPSMAVWSIDDVSISKPDPSTRSSVMGINTRVVCSLHFLEKQDRQKDTRDREHSVQEHTHTLEGLQNRFVNIELVTEPFIRINTSGVNRWILCVLCLRLFHLGLHSSLDSALASVFHITRLRFDLILRGTYKWYQS